MFTERAGMFIYNLVLRIYVSMIYAASLRNHKAKQWVKGRRKWKSNLENEIRKLGTQKRIWMHCASYGEFEQGRPLLEAIRKQHPEYKLILSFFSPSGYEAFKNWKGADLVTYLPFDSRSNARDFIAISQPESVIFIKYEFWLNFLIRLRAQGIPTYLVSAVFKPHHPFFRWYGGIFRNSLKCFTEIFVQDEKSEQLLKEIGIGHVVLSGDTRIDRVLEIRKNFEALPFFEGFCHNSEILVAGSTWPKDEAFLLDVFKKLKRQNLKLILVPHEVDAKSISETEKLLRTFELDYLLYSKAEKTETYAADILIVDTIGLLAKLYHYASVAYIGGGFDTGIHNCLEPAVHMKPLLFYGDGHHKYNEAVELIELGAARNVMQQDELQSAINDYLDNKDLLSEIRSKLEAYFTQKSGTTEKLISRLFGVSAQP